MPEGQERVAWAICSEETVVKEEKKPGVKRNRPRSVKNMPVAYF